MKKVIGLAFVGMSEDFRNSLGPEGDGRDLYGLPADTDGVHRGTARADYVSNVLAADQARETVTVTVAEKITKPVYDDRSMLRTPEHEFKGMPLRSNKFRPLEAPKGKTYSDTYEVDHYKMVSPDQIDKALAEHSAAQLKPRPEFLTEGVSIRRKSAYEVVRPTRRAAA